MNLTLTPLRIVLIILVVGALCFLFKDMVEASLNQCERRIQSAKGSTCNSLINPQNSSFTDCQNCFTSQTSQTCGKLPSDEKAQAKDIIDSLCQKTCDSFTCSGGYISKDDPSNIPCDGDCDQTQCCNQNTCDKFPCPSKSSTLKKKASKINCDGDCTLNQCCDPKTCDSFTCPPGFAPKKGAKNKKCGILLGCNKTKCCQKIPSPTPGPSPSPAPASKKTCKGFQCPTNYKLINKPHKTQCKKSKCNKQTCCKKIDT